MKTMNTRLLTITILFSALIIATTSVSAQRRTTQNSNRTESRAVKSDRNKRETVQKNSTSKNYNTKSGNSGNRRLTGNRDTRMKSDAKVTQSTRNNKGTRSQRPVVTNNSRNTTQIKAAPAQKKSGTITTRRSDSRNNPVVQNNRSRSNSARNSGSVNQNRIGNNQTNRSGYAVPNERRATGQNNVRPGSRNNPSRARNIYRHDANDNRYVPNSNYSGSNRYWTRNDRPTNMNYNRNDRNFYRNYNYKKFYHWDRRWENYRWNLNSWRDYYRGYNPYAYRYNKYYYHHPVYGHVLRRFDVRPLSFIHNHHRYYCYDGHFFRYRRGIGYILVDIPFGIVFDRLPYGYERVYINGYMYFRVGNLFFEFTNLGFRLVHYPERYFAYNDGYANEGYYFDDDIYY